jgi:hypothetical protein
MDNVKISLPVMNMAGQIVLMKAKLSVKVALGLVQNCKVTSDFSLDILTINQGVIMIYQVELVAHNFDSGFTVFVDNNSQDYVEITNLAKNLVVKNNTDIPKESLNLVKITTLKEEPQPAKPYIYKPVSLIGRPQRTQNFSDDDMLNFKIALETSNSIDKFLATI